MRYYIELTSDQLVSSPGTNDILRSMAFKRDTNGLIELVFSHRGAPQELPAGATGIFAIKPKGKYDAAPLVMGESWVKSGTGPTTVYSFSPEFTSAALNTLLGHGDGNISNDVESIVAMGEIQWIVDGKKYKTQTVDVTIANDVIKEDDDTPSQLPDPAQWMRGALALSFPPENASVVGMIPTNINGPITSNGLAILVPEYMSNIGPGSGTGGKDRFQSANFRSEYDAGSARWYYRHIPTNSAWYAPSTADTPAQVVSWIGTGSVSGNPGMEADIASGTEADCIGQMAIVGASDIHVCVRLSPVKWIGPLAL